MRSFSGSLLLISCPRWCVPLLVRIGSIPIKGKTVNRHYFFKMSPNFAEFLLDTTNNGNEILAVLEDIVEVTETGGTDL